MRDTLLVLTGAMFVCYSSCWLVDAGVNPIGAIFVPGYLYVGAILLSEKVNLFLAEKMRQKGGQNGQGNTPV